jgi:hypothetical protein
VNIKFEAQSDGNVDSGLKKGENLIQSTVKEIQIYGPLSVQPKYVELIRGAQYQVVISGGPVSLDASISYELIVIEQKKKTG